MKRRLDCVLIAVGWWLVFGAAQGQVARDQAVQIVTKVVSPGSAAGEFSAYVTLAPLPAGTVVRSFDGVTPARTLQAPTWFGYIDDAPLSFFSHPTRFVFIDAATGATEVWAEEWWPLVDGRNPFRRAAVTAAPALLVASSRDPSSP